MTADSLANRLRTLRKESGLTQVELSRILGFRSEIPVSRHEHSTTVPNLLTALAYEVIFRVPISTQFRGLAKTVEAGIEARLAELEQELEQHDGKGRDAASIARKLIFLCARKDPEIKRHLA